MKKLIVALLSLTLLMPNVVFSAGEYSENLVEPMTSNSMPSGVSVTASSEFNGSEAFKAFNGVFDYVSTNAWVSLKEDYDNGNWLMYDFGQNNEVAITKYRIQADHYYNSGEPRSWDFEGSNDGITWTTLDVQNKTIDWQKQIEGIFTFDNNTEYRYYRFNNITSDYEIVQIDEIDLMSSSPNTSGYTLSGTTDSQINSDLNLSLSLDVPETVYAQDIIIEYPSEYLTFEGVSTSNGIKIAAEQIETGKLRFIVASLGESNKIETITQILNLNFTPIKEGTATVDVVKGRLANIDSEWNLDSSKCGEIDVIIEAINDVNRSGSYSLIDLAIDAFYYGKSVSETDQLTYNADIVVDSDNLINDLDLVEVAILMTQNSEYEFNN